MEGYGRRKKRRLFNLWFVWPLRSKDDVRKHFVFYKNRVPNTTSANNCWFDKGQWSIEVARRGCPLYVQWIIIFLINVLLRVRCVKCAVLNFRPSEVPVETATPTAIHGCNNKLRCPAPISRLRVEKIEGGLMVAGVVIAANCQIILPIFGFLFMLVGCVLTGKKLVNLPPTAITSPLNVTKLCALRNRLFSEITFLFE